MHPRTLAALVAAAILVGTGTLSAQTNIEVNAGLELNLSQPGARSLGMGGAFLGLADDATAAYTNPAGLSNLSVTEFAVEGRAWQYRSRFTAAGAGVFSNGELDDSGLIDAENEKTLGAISFGSVVYPSKKNWTVAFFYHQLADYEAEISTRGADAFDGSGRFLFGLRAVEGNTLLDVRSWGTAIAYRLGNRFSVGISLATTELAFLSETRRFDSAAAQNTDFWTNRQRLTGEDEDFTGSIGFQWQLGEHLSLGGAYRRGSEFEITTISDLGPATRDEGLVYDEDVATFRMPDSVGLGLAIKSASFRFLADWVRTGYSSLTDSMVDVFGDIPARQAAVSQLRTDDVDEFHVGMEVVLTRLANPVALRVGAWLDPDHRVRFQGRADTIEEQVEALIFRPGEDQIHYTAGFGINFQDGRFELNLAADVADRITTGSLSFVARPF